MITKNQIKEIIEKKIQKDEKLGTQTGGSGHLGHVSFVLNWMNVKDLPGNKYEVEYKYTLVIETEFTYYPDNPPMEYPNSKKVVIDENGSIEEIEEIKQSDSSEIDWSNTQEKINTYLIAILNKIEWHYGEGRAPIVYPPDYYLMTTEKFEVQYCCDIKLEFSDNEVLYFRSTDEKDLFHKIKNDLNIRFLSFEE